MLTRVISEIGRQADHHTRMVKELENELGHLIAAIIEALQIAR